MNYPPKYLPKYLQKHGVFVHHKIRGATADRAFSTMRKQWVILKKKIRIGRSGNSIQSISKHFTQVIYLGRFHKEYIQQFLTK